MADKATIGTDGGADEALVRVLEQTASNKVLEKLDQLLPGVVHEAVTEAIVFAMHAEPSVPLPKAKPPRQRKQPAEAKRPKAGGRCEAVWKELDKIEARKHETPALTDILRVGERRSWNPNNTRVEYYQWRKDKGISGRLKTQEQAAQA